MREAEHKPLILWLGAASHLWTKEAEPTSLILRCEAQPSLEGRTPTTHRHRSPFWYGTISALG
jgi:hypothetical protein